MTLNMVELIVLALVCLGGCAGKKIEMAPQVSESGEWVVLKSGGKCQSDIGNSIEARACRSGDICMTRKDFEQLMDVVFAKCN